MKKWTILALILSLSLIGIAQPSVNIGDPVPEIKLKDVNGEWVSLSSFKGKWILLDFWASWCGPCRVSNKAWVKEYAKAKQKNFEIIGISLDDKQASWKKAIAQDQITWVQLNDPGGWEAPTAKAWNIEAIPTTFLIDPTGKVVAVDPSIDLVKKKLK